LTFFLPLEGELRAVPNVLLAILGLLFFFVIKSNDLKKCFRLDFKLFSVLLLYLVLNLAIANGFLQSVFVVEKLIIILAFYLLYLPINIEKNVKTSFVLGVALALIVSLVRILFYILETGGFSFSEGETVTKVLITERIYLSLMAVISFIFSIEYIQKTSRRIKWLLTINIVILILFVLLVSARMALLSILIIGVYNLVYLKKYKLLLSSFIITITVLAASFMLNKNLQERFLFSNRKSSFIENFKKWEPRVEIWNCSYKIYTNNSILEQFVGLNSFEKTNEHLVDCYSTSIIDKTKRNWFVKTRYNTHNQYLDFLISTGIIGFLLFIGFLIVLFYKNRKSRINTSLLLAILFILLIENCFHRQIGAYIFAMIYILLSKNSKFQSKPLELNEKN
jgi:O-antigen ligase